MLYHSLLLRLTIEGQVCRAQHWNLRGYHCDWWAGYRSKSRCAAWPSQASWWFCVNMCSFLLGVGLGQVDARISLCFFSPVFTAKKGTENKSC